MSAPVNIQPPRRVILKDDEALADIGTPRVVVTYYGGEAKVEVDRCPWGWRNVERTFLNAASPGVLSYAEKLFGRLKEEAEAKAALRAKRKLFSAIGRDLSRLGNRGDC